MPLPEPHPQLLGLLADAKDHPDDDTPRLILADWLDDHGHGELAGSIRAALAGDTALPAEFCAALRPLVLSWHCQRGLIHVHAQISEVRAIVPAEPVFPWIESLAVAVSVDDRDAPEELPLLGEVNAVSFAGWYLGDAAALRLLDRLTTGRVQRLDVGQCDLNTSFLRGLAIWPCLPRLSALDLSGNGFSGTDLAAFTHAPGLANLRSLNLSHNLAEDAAVLGLAASPSLARLIDLDLSDNELTGIALAALADWPGLGQLQVLRLQYNDLDSDGFAGLFAALRKLPVAALQVLDLEDNSLRDDGLRDLVTVSTLTHCEELNLCDNLIRDAVVDLVGSPCLPSLRRLDLSATLFSPRTITALAESSLLRRLTALNLRSCQLTDDAVTPLLHAAPLPMLRSFRLGNNLILANTRLRLREAFPCADFE